MESLCGSVDRRGRMRGRWGWNKEGRREVGSTEEGSGGKKRRRNWRWWRQYGINEMQRGERGTDRLIIKKNIA